MDYRNLQLPPFLRIILRLADVRFILTRRVSFAALTITVSKRIKAIRQLTLTTTTLTIDRRPAVRRRTATMSDGPRIVTTHIPLKNQRRVRRVVVQIEKCTTTV